MNYRNYFEHFWENTIDYKIRKPPEQTHPRVDAYFLVQQWINRDSPLELIERVEKFTAKARLLIVVPSLCLFDIDDR